MARSDGKNGHGENEQGGDDDGSSGSNGGGGGDGNGDDNDAGKPDDGIGGHDKRDIDVNVNGGGIQIDTQSQTDTNNRVRIDIQVSGSGGPSKRLSARIRAFDSAAVSGTSGSSEILVARVDFKVKFQSLLEYQEQDGVPGYSGNDTTGATLNLGDQSYTFAVEADQGTAPNDIKVVSATSSNFKITCKVGGLLFNTSGVWTFTNSAKIDVDIKNFPYSGTLTNPRLALVIGVVSELTQTKTIQRDDTQPSTDSNVVVVRSGSDKTSFFSWVKTADVTAPPATVDVIAGPLTVSSVDDDDDSDHQDKRTIVYSFDAIQPTTVHWDPLVGVNTLGSGAATLSATMLSIVLLFVVSVLAL